VSLTLVTCPLTPFLLMNTPVILITLMIVLLLRRFNLEGSTLRTATDTLLFHFLKQIWSLSHHFLSSMQWHIGFYPELMVAWSVCCASTICFFSCKFLPCVLLSCCTHTLICVPALHTGLFELCGYIVLAPVQVLGRSWSWLLSWSCSQSWSWSGSRSLAWSWSC
jgi:hypothetical protein